MLEGRSTRWPRHGSLLASCGVLASHRLHMGLVRLAALGGGPGHHASLVGARVWIFDRFNTTVLAARSRCCRPMEAASRKGSILIQI